jgi:predicted  nucleic acid-binding Zn-ribbon protein
VDQLSNIETQIQTLWDKAKRAGELIARLREEKRALQKQNEFLEQELAKLRSELVARNAQLASAAREVKSAEIFSNGEREELSAKVKQLLAKIDAYL